MTNRTVPHLKQRIGNIEQAIADFAVNITNHKEKIKYAEEDIFALKVEKQALIHALKDWQEGQE